MSAKGLARRRFSRRRRPTAAAFSASQARWYPPIPLTATIAPPPISVAASATASTAASHCGAAALSAISFACGPQVGQAMASAWNRRSCAAPYSARQLERAAD